MRAMMSSAVRIHACIIKGGAEISETQHRPSGRMGAVGVLVLTLAVLPGCNVPRDRLAAFNQLYQQGNVPGAQQYAERRVNPQSPPAGDNLLWALQLGAIKRTLGDFAQSNEWFDRAEEMMKHYDTSFKGLDAVGTTLVNETVLPYRGEEYDAIMVNTYKALNFMSLGQDDLARVEFNRALERQMRARERFNAEIQKLKDKMASDRNSGKVNYTKTMENPDLQTRIAAQYPGLNDFQAYPDFVNPFATYLAGVFFTMIADPGKAVDLLRESAGMVPDNRTVAQDFEQVQQWLDKGTAPEPAVWVIYEGGLGPVKEEFRVDLPLFLATNKLFYAGIALPRLSPRRQAVEHLEVDSSPAAVQTELVADMDRVIHTEFAKDYPGILMRAVVAAAAKAVAQTALTNQRETGAQVMGLMMAVYSAATTTADVRIWTSLPKQFQVVRVPMPTERRLTVRAGGQTMEIPLKGGRYALVYIRMISGASKPIWEVVARGEAVALPVTPAAGSANEAPASAQKN